MSYSKVSFDIRNRQQYCRYELLYRFYSILNSNVSLCFRYPLLGWAWRLSLQRLPRCSSISRVHARCVYSGRGRGILQKYGMARMTFRENASVGFFPGMQKASW